MDNVQLVSAVVALQKEVSTLKDTLNVYENWNSEVKNWYGKEVLVRAVNNVAYKGMLKWTDRYNVCLMYTADTTQPRKECIFTKGGIISIQLA